MKIIAYFITYNEIDLLPLQHKWCKNQGIEMYVIDNCSNDGTVSYLKKTTSAITLLIPMELLTSAHYWPK